MSRLTEREREVARLLAQGVKPSQIAARLCVSTSTVKTHISNMRNKTGAQSTLELAVQAARASVGSNS